MRDGEVQDPGVLGDAIKDLFTSHKLPRDVRIGIANQRVAVRTLRLPLIEDASELDAAVRFAAQDHIPMPLDRAVLDWQVIPPAPGRGGEGVEVVAVAARREMLAVLMEAVRRAGLRLVGIDHSSFALIRALKGPSTVAAPPTAEAAAGAGVQVPAGTPLLPPRRHHQPRGRPRVLLRLLPRARLRHRGHRPVARRQEQPHPRARPPVAAARRPRGPDR